MSRWENTGMAVGSAAASSLVVVWCSASAGWENRLSFMVSLIVEV